MLCLRMLVPAMLVGLAAGAAAETAPVVPLPWTETFTMTLQDKVRSFVVYEGTTWLVMDPSDLKDPVFLVDKDVMLPGKFERTDSQRAWFFSLPRFRAEGRLEHWATRIEGDNLYVFGRMSQPTPEEYVLTVRTVAAAESDTQIINLKLNQLALGDYAGRLAVATWVRAQAATQGNADFWVSAADTIVAQAVDAAAADAAARKDAELIEKAVSWAIEQSKDSGLAARAASQPWLVEAGGPTADKIAKRLRLLGFLWYKDRWHPKTTALSMEFEDRFIAIPWKDAEGFFKLGRWAESHLDDLPSARDLSYRCYQSGYRGDANHNGIRRKLGLEAVNGGAGGTATTSANDGPYQHDATGTVIPGPDGWKRAPSALDGDVTWLDPNSETAYISARVVSGGATGSDFENLWASTSTSWRTRQSFAELMTSELPFANGQARSLRFSYQEGRYTRFGELCLGRENTGRVAVIVTAAFVEAEQAAVSAVVQQTINRVALTETNRAVSPNGVPQNQAPGAAPAPGAGSAQPDNGAPSVPPGN